MMNGMAENESDLLRVSEAAKELGVATETIYRWGADGKIQFVILPGGSKRVKRSDVQRIVDGGNTK